MLKSSKQSARRKPVPSSRDKVSKTKITKNEAKDTLGESKTGDLLEIARQILEPPSLVALFGWLFVKLNASGLPLELSKWLLGAAILLVLHRAGINENVLVIAEKIWSARKR